MCTKPHPGMCSDFLIFFYLSKRIVHSDSIVQCNINDLPKSIFDKYKYFFNQITRHDFACFYQPFFQAAIFRQCVP